jgi:hypothetical protein
VLELVGLHALALGDFGESKSKREETDLPPVTFAKIATEEPFWQTVSQ